MSAESPFLTLRAAARRFRVSPERLRAAIATGELRAFRAGKRWVRISHSDLIAWMRSRPVAPSGAKRAEAIRLRVAQVMEGK